MNGPDYARKLMVSVHNMANTFTSRDYGTFSKVKGLLHAITESLLTTNGNGLNLAFIVNIKAFHHYKVRLTVGHINRAANVLLGNLAQANVAIRLKAGNFKKTAAALLAVLALKGKIDCGQVLISGPIVAAIVSEDRSRIVGVHCTVAPYHKSSLIHYFCDDNRQLVPILAGGNAE